jgi:hypothetical protein
MSEQEFDLLLSEHKLGKFIKPPVKDEGDEIPF